MKCKIQRNLLATLAASIGLFAFSGAASAAPIMGTIGFGGIFNPTGGTGLGDATGISIGFSNVTAATGDFAPTLGENVLWSALDFNPANTPLAALWTVDLGGSVYSFDLDDVAVDLQSATQLNLSGSGTLFATGFDATDGLWTFSGQGSNVFFTFSSISTAGPVPVPAPATLLLIGIGLAGLGASRRRRA